MDDGKTVVDYHFREKGVGEGAFNTLEGRGEDGAGFYPVAERVDRPRAKRRTKDRKLELMYRTYCAGLVESGQGYLPYFNWVEVRAGQSGRLQWRFKRELRRLRG